MIQAIYHRRYYGKNKGKILTQQKSYRSNPLVVLRETQRKRYQRSKKRLTRTGMIILENVEFDTT